MEFKIVESKDAEMPSDDHRFKALVFIVGGIMFVGMGLSVAGWLIIHG